MGILNNIGGALLDVQQGMEYAKANERRDADWQRNQKRADMQDQIAQGGLEDYQRGRADTAGSRAAFAKGGLDAVGPAAQQRGDIAGYQAAAAAKVNDLKTTIAQREAEAQAQMQPTKIATEKINTEGALARAPAENKIATTQQQMKLRDMAERQTLDLYILGHLDPKAAVEGFNNSGLVAPNEKISDFKINKDNGDLTVIDDQGNERTIPHAFFNNLQRKLYPPKLEKVKHDESIVEINQRTGGVTPKFTGPGIDSYTPLPENSPGAIDKRTGKFVPAGPGLGGASTKRKEATAAHQDARVKLAMDYIGKALGGTFDALGQISLPPGTQDTYKKVSPRAEELVKGGMDPVKAGQQALEEINRTATLAKVGAAPPQVGATPTNNAAGLVDWKQYQSTPQ